MEIALRREAVLRLAKIRFNMSTRVTGWEERTTHAVIIVMKTMQQVET